MSIIIIIHRVTCLWYDLGNLHWNAGDTSWIEDIADFSGEANCYAVAYLWVLERLTAAPTDPSIGPKQPS